MKADTVTKDFVSDTSVFADIFNYYIYNGKQVVLPEHLVERDSTKIALPYGGDGEVVPVQKYRDIQKLCTTMTDGTAEYVLYAVEGQQNIHYAMPVRNNLYDALDYAKQVEETAKLHRRTMKEERKHRQEEKTKKGQQAGQEQNQKRKDASGLVVKTPEAGEFLGGFWKEDRLIPSITVTILFSGEEWDGPLSLFDMMDVKNPELFSYMDNYHLRLIAPARMADEEIMKFQSSLREVLFFIKYSKDRENMDRILGENKERFRELERRAVDVIQAVTNSKIKYEKSEVKVDMCQAIREMQEEAELRGRKEERKEMCQVLQKMQESEGCESGKEEYKEIYQAIREMQEEEAKKVAKRFYEMGPDIEKIAEGVGCTTETVKVWLEDSASN